MSITKNVFTLKKVYELIVDRQWITYDPLNDPYGLWTWGCNGSGQLGDNTIINKSSPIQIPGTEWATIGFNNVSAFALKNDGTLWTWGNGGSGRLGLNDAISRSSPTQIPGTQWTKTVGHCFGGFAFKTDGTLWSWGFNTPPVTRLGLNDVIPRSSPAQIPGTQWTNINGGFDTILATKSNGTLWVWGSNFQGQAGINSAPPASPGNFCSPRQIPGTQWVSASSGIQGSHALKTDGTLWGWGYNETSREVGDGTSIRRISPTQIPGNQWKDVCHRQTNVHALKTDGTLWAWGGNGGGTLGIGTTGGSFCSPVQVPGDQWRSIGGLVSSIIATKNDNTLWGWGSNAGGILGDNTVISRSSPRQIPGTLWTCEIANTGLFSGALKAT